MGGTFLRPWKAKEKDNFDSIEWRDFIRTELKNIDEKFVELNRWLDQLTQDKCQLRDEFRELSAEFGSENIRLSQAARIQQEQIERLEKNVSYAMAASKELVDLRRAVNDLKHQQFVDTERVQTFCRDMRELIEHKVTTFAKVVVDLKRTINYKRLVAVGAEKEIKLP